MSFSSLLCLGEYLCLCISYSPDVFVSEAVDGDQPHALCCNLMGSIICLMLGLPLSWSFYREHTHMHTHVAIHTHTPRQGTTHTHTHTYIHKHTFFKMGRHLAHTHTTHTHGHGAMFRCRWNAGAFMAKQTILFYMAPVLPSLMSHSNVATLSAPVVLQTMLNKANSHGFEHGTAAHH